MIENHFPASNARNVPRNSRIIITFKEAMKPDTVTASTVLIKNMSAGGNALTAADVVVTASSDNLTFTLSPNNLLGSPSSEQQ